MRLRPAVLCALVALGSAVSTGHAAAPAPSRPTPCTLSYAAPAGDAPSLYAGPNDPDLDVTGVSWSFGPSDVVVTAKVAALAAGPRAGWGDQFEAIVDDRASKTRVTFGYFRSPSGGGPVFHGGKVAPAASPAGMNWSAYPGGATHLVADFDTVRSQVVLSIPRADLEAAFGTSLSRLSLTVLGVNSYAMDASYDPMMADFGTAAVDTRTTSFRVAECDRWLGSHGPRSRPASACALDVVAETGDEISRTSDALPTRDDSVDVARVSYRVTSKALTVTARVARLTDRPLFGTGTGYTVALAGRGTVASFGVTRDAVTGVTVKQYGGKTVAHLTATAAFDPVRSLVTLTIPRADLAAAFGLKDARSLVVANPALTAFWTLDGTSVATANDATAPGRTLKFAAC
jgi:hypothetical protein